MKILMVSRRYPPDVISGAETVFSNLYQQARKHHEVRLVVGFRVARERVPAEAVAVDLRGKAAMSYGYLCQAALAEAYRFRPDVVLGNSIEVFVPGIPTMVLVHDLHFGGMKRGGHTWGRELFYRFRSLDLHGMIAVSRASRDRLVGVGVPAEKIRVIPNGVELGRFLPYPQPPRSLIHFVYPARIVPEKGQHLVLEALGRMTLTQRQSLHVTLVGALVDRAYLERLKLAALHYPVDILCDVPDLVPYYQRADVVVFPTLLEEGFGYTAVEGMACGKPVIWCDQPAIREATGGIGVPVRWGDSESLKDAMLWLAERPSVRERLGREGRDFVDQHYDWGQVWAQYESFLKSSWTLLSG